MKTSKKSERATSPKQGGKLVGKIIGLILIPLVACLIVFGVGFLLHRGKNSGFQEQAEDFLAAYCAGDLDDAMEFCIEPSRDALAASMEANALAAAFYGEDAKVSCETGEVYAAGDKKIKELQKMLKRDYDYKCDISAAYLIKLEWKLKAGQTKETAGDQLVALKIDDEWKLWYGYSAQ